MGPSGWCSLDRDVERLLTWSVRLKFASMRALKDELRGVVAPPQVLAFAEKLRAMDLMDSFRHFASPLFRRNATQYLGTYWKLINPEVEEGDPDYFRDETNKALLESFDYDSSYPLEGANELLARYHEFARIILVNAMR